MVQLSVKPLPGDQNQKIAKKSAKLKQQKAREIAKQKKNAGNIVVNLYNVVVALVWGRVVGEERERVQTTWPPISFEV